MRIKALVSAQVCITVALAGPVVLPTGAWTRTTKTTKPLLEVCRELEDKYHWLITYQEAPVLNPSELHPAVAPTRSPMQELNVTPVLFNIPEVDDNSVTTKTALLKGVIAAYNASGNRGNFKLIQSGDHLHIVPTSVLAADGSVQNVQPLLDTLVTFPMQQHRAGIVVSMVVGQVARARHASIGEDSFPTNLFAQATVTEGANEVPARDVLARLAGEINQLPLFREFYSTPVRLSLELLYYPTGQNFILNVGGPGNEYGWVPTPPSPPTSTAPPTTNNQWWRTVPPPQR